MGGCIELFVVGLFLVFSDYIFGIARLFLFQMIVGGGTRPCVVYLSLLYCCYNHLSLVVGMVTRCLPVSSYMCVSSLCVWIVFVSVAISFSGLHSIADIWVYGIIVDGGMNLGSLFCVGVRCVLTMLL